MNVVILMAALFIPGKVQVVVSPKAPPAVWFAASEATNFLSQVLGAEVPVNTAFAPGKMALVLGVNEWSAAEGVDPSKLPRDSFVIKAKGDRVYVAGMDDPKQNLSEIGRQHGVAYREHATLFGVYEFLHRHAGVRFYFPGEMGTYVPRKQSFEVAEGETAVTPDFSYRDCYINGAGTYPGVDLKATAQTAAKELYKLRLRESTFKIPCCHGQNRFRIAKRFSDTHPEYFQLRKDGTRCTGTKFAKHWQGQQLCHTSPVWDVFRREAIERVRKGEPWVDVMPQDGMRPCHCANCQRFFNTTNFNLSSGYATELIWSNTVSVARAITAAGLKGGVSQMAYGTYRDIPSVDIPENVAVVLAVGGPWAESHPDIRDRQIDFVRTWSEKLGRKVSWIWTYPMKNYGRLQTPNVPQHAPRAYIGFYRRAAPYIDGSFVESNQGKDSILYNYLNYYVWSRFAWDHDEDVEAILAEHHRLMFGAGAPEMTKFFDGLERKWIGECAIPSLIGETEIGPWLTGPTEKQLWSKIWSAAELARFRGYLESAASAVPPNSMEARRIAWIRESFYEPLYATRTAVVDRFSVAKELARRAAAYESGNLIANRTRWSCSKGVRLDKTTCITPAGAYRLEVNGGNLYVGYSVKGKLKPGAKYRISYFIKTDRLEGSGACIEYEEYTPKYRAVRFPEGAYVRGSEDWMHVSGEFVAGEDVGKPHDRSMVWLRVFKSTGTVWFDGMLLEEIKE